MKKQMLFLGCLLLCLQVTAQPLIPAGNGPVKLIDVVTAYKHLHPNYGKMEFMKSILPGLNIENEEKDYQFNRWLWYWEQHLDNNGYMVSPAKTWQEWEKMKSNDKHSSAKTTSGGAPNWTFLGPDSTASKPGGVGRINMIAFHPTDINTYWVATPGGGAWKTTSNGANWVSITDNLPDLGISDIVVNPLNPNTLYLCSGDKENNTTYGVGVLKSYNGGISWNNTGITWTTSQFNIANSMVINPQDTNSLILATTVGIYRSHNGGAAFTLVSSGNFKQVLYKPNDTSVVYATSFIDFSTPYTYAQIWRSLDGGNTWAQQTHYYTTSRITLAVTPAAPDMVMAIASDFDTISSGNIYGLEGIYKSSNSGSSFTLLYAGGCTGNLLSYDPAGSACGGQGWYTLPLAISPVDSNKILTGGVYSWASSDGGHTWTMVNGMVSGIADEVYIHADKHWMGFHPLLPSRFFETNDGGIFLSDNPVITGTWSNVTGRMGIQQIYRTAVSDIAGFGLEGSQDNGTSLILPSGGSKYDFFVGDGMECAMDYADSTIAYVSYQQGHIYRLNPTADTPSITSVDISWHIPGSVEGTGAWVTPFVIVPSCHTCLLAGYMSIYKTRDMGNTWTAISPVLNDSLRILRVVVAKTDSNTIYATNEPWAPWNSQTIYYTHDGGSSWNSLTAPYPGIQHISDIIIDPRDNNHIWITYSGYGSPQVADWHLLTGWHQMNVGLPDVPVNCITIDQDYRDIYVGTELGVFYRDSTMSSWLPYNTGLPSVMVTDLQINYTKNELWAATYGRSEWKSQKHNTTLSQVSIVPFIADGITVSPNPNHGYFTVQVKNIADKVVQMRLTNNNGKTVWQKTGTIQVGKLTVNCGNLVAGSYVFEITSENAIDGRQIVVIY